GLAKAQTSDEYFKMVLARRGMKYDDVTIENIMTPPALAPALKDGKVDAIVSWEPYNTAVLEQVPDSYVVLRGGGHLSYVMIATAHEPTIRRRRSSPRCKRRIRNTSTTCRDCRPRRTEAVIPDAVQRKRSAAVHRCSGIQEHGGPGSRVCSAPQRRNLRCGALRPG